MIEKRIFGKIVRVLFFFGFHFCGTFDLSGTIKYSLRIDGYSNDLLWPFSVCLSYFSVERCPQTVFFLFLIFFIIIFFRLVLLILFFCQVLNKIWLGKNLFYKLVKLLNCFVQFLCVYFFMKCPLIYQKQMSLFV